MGKKNRKSTKESLTESEDVVNNPFGSLTGLDLPSVEVAASADPKPEATPKSRDILRVRIEKKGRRGKTVTVIEGFSEDPSSTATQIKQALGTGGSYFEGIIELQGDCRPKAAAFLRDKGYTVKGA